MKPTDSILKYAKDSILSQSESISKLVDYINEDFQKSVELILKCEGRIVITGIGKSAIIAQKIVATFNSTGTPSLFLHASEAIHGDLGMMKPEDVVICISKSGNSPEIKALLPIIQDFGNQVIAITSNLSSFLAKNATFVINAHVDREACPIGLAPTNSTTAQLVLGDALAVCLMNLRNFSREDFAKYHPGGALGKKLLLRVGDMLDRRHKPSVHGDASIQKVIVEISEKRLGVTAVIENNNVVGIITDGDIRRMLNKRESIKALTAKDIMTSNPKKISSSLLVSEALDILEDNKITQLIVEDNGDYQGVLHLHDILKEGII